MSLFPRTFTERTDTCDIELLTSLHALAKDAALGGGGEEHVDLRADFVEPVVDPCLRADARGFDRVARPAQHAHRRAALTADGFTGAGAAKTVDTLKQYGADKVYESSIDALIKGTTDGLQIALNVGATLIVFIALATMVDKILRGANPADLPIEQATEYVLIVNPSDVVERPPITTGILAARNWRPMSSARGNWFDCTPTSPIMPKPS